MKRFHPGRVLYLRDFFLQESVSGPTDMQPRFTGEAGRRRIVIKRIQAARRYDERDDISRILLWDSATFILQCPDFADQEFHTSRTWIEWGLQE